MNNPGYTNKGILIVEDNVLLSMVQKQLVEDIGYCVLASVRTGFEAIQEVQQKNPALILMDILLNGELDGIDTMKEIRKSSPVPVIYLSGSSDPDVYERAKAIAPIGFLKKPVSKYELESCIKEVFVHV